MAGLKAFVASLHARVVCSEHSAAWRICSKEGCVASSWELVPEVEGVAVVVVVVVAVEEEDVVLGVEKVLG